MTRKRCLRFLLASLLFLLLAFSLDAMWKQYQQQHLNNSLIGAINRDNVEQVKTALRKGASPDARRSTTRGDSWWALLQSTFLHHRNYTIVEDPAIVLATPGGNTLIMALLLSYGANPDAQDAYGATALKKAAFLGEREAVALLLNERANVNLPDKQGTTPLMGACLYNQAKIVELLLKGGADPNRQDDSGKTALQFLGPGHDASIARMLRKTGAKR